jgi:hypothetical protein
MPSEAQPNSCNLCLRKQIRMKDVSTPLDMTK